MISSFMSELEYLDLPNWPFKPIGIAYGNGSRLQLEVIYSESDSSPKASRLKTAWKQRQEGRGVPLLIVVLYDGKAALAGPAGEDPPVYMDLDCGQVERICEEALEQPNRQAALRTLRDSLGAIGEDGLPGLRNEGFLASHELAKGVPSRVDWAEANARAQQVVASKGGELLSALGYSVEPLDNITNILRASDQKKAVAVLLSDHETPEAGSERIPGNLSPVSYALARADEENLDWVILVHGRKIRLYPVKMGVGVGRRGRTETFLECHTGLLPDDAAAYLWLLFSAEALGIGGSLSNILDDSKDFAGDLASRLRERIYDEVIPRIAEGLAAARGVENPTTEDLDFTYQMAMRVLFRLLFIAYGEDKDLLPYRFNRLYKVRSLKSKARELQEIDSDGFDESDSWWREICALFRAVESGNRDWGVPAYGGGLFASDSSESEIGAALAQISLPNNVLGPALQYLLLVPAEDGMPGPVDFRSLGVREFGTIYEGLLESELSLADADLTVETRGKSKDAYRPCKEGEEPKVPKGTVYLHNSSGARKATGSYYTKHFAVEHLLERSLEPALDDHFARLDELDELEAAEAFFDFRVADIAMGSGHFLVASIDRIEARFSGYLAKRPLPEVSRELEHMRSAAVAALGDAADSYEQFEDNALLRRLIARRCIYGVDINEVAVQLARLGMWIHTFVPGLPLSLLDRNLIHGNSLVGIGQLDEFHEAIQGSDMPLFQMDASTFLSDARDALARLGKIADATASEIRQARAAWREADAAIESTRALCDILTASRIEAMAFPILLSDWENQKHQIAGGAEHSHALRLLEGMNHLHFPVVFPEVFLRDRAGFDVLVGNPPWEKLHVEEHEFWARHSPGLRGLIQRKRESEYLRLKSERPDLGILLDEEVAAANKIRNALIRGPYPGLGSGHPDLYKAFCWRYWQITSRFYARFAMVIPRSVLVSKGCEGFRKTLIQASCSLDLTVLVNKSGWLFPGMHEQNPVPVLMCVSSKESSLTEENTISLRGPFRSFEEYQSGMEDEACFASRYVLDWTESASIPMLSDSSDANVFDQLREAPNLSNFAMDGCSVHPLQGDMNATTDKDLMVFAAERPTGAWPIYKGSSFNLWEPDTGEYYAWGQQNEVGPVLQQKRIRSARQNRSIFSLFDFAWCDDPNTHPSLHPRIVFRDVTNRTNRRTIICSLVPPNVYLTHKAPYLLLRNGGAKQQAFLLGLLSSLPLDWYARRFVETSLTFFILNAFPVPQPGDGCPIAERVIAVSGRLAAKDDAFATWAAEVGVDCGPLSDDEKYSMVCELDALVAVLYGLKKPQLSHIFETHHIGWSYQAQLDRTLSYFEQWSLRGLK